MDENKPTFIDIDTFMEEYEVDMSDWIEKETHDKMLKDCLETIKNLKEELNVWKNRTNQLCTELIRRRIYIRT